MSMYEMFDTDKAAETDGIWADYGSFRVRLARAGGANKDFQKTLELKTRPYRRLIQTESIDTALAIKLLRETYATAVVRDWQTKVDGEWKQGIETEDGTLLPFSRENVLAVYDRLPAIFEDHQELASKLALYRVAVREVQAKN